MTPIEKAIRAIERSCLLDWNNALEWAQWTREVASAALYEPFALDRIIARGCPNCRNLHPKDGQ